MAFCNKCGTQLSDGAKFCPKCGNPIESTQTKKKVSKNSSNIIVHTENDTSVQDNEKDCLSTWEKIALGVAGLYAFGSLCVSIGDGMWIAIFISLCALGVICAVFMGTIEKKYAWTTAIVSFLIVGGAIGASTPDEKEGNQTQTEQKQESPAEKQDSNPYAKFVGKYVLYDDEGGKGQTFIVASDGRFLQDNSFNESDFKASGYISPKNDKQFEVSLSEKVFGIKQVWSYKNNHTYAKAWDISYNNTLLFDLNEKRMYIDIKEYNNRDYTKPEYYKFRFTKQ